MSGKIITLVGPSGAGKSSLAKKLRQEFTALTSTINYTTRPMRAGEVEGRPYFFVTESKFKDRRDNGFFVEWAKVHNNYYGTAYEQVDQIWKSGKAILMDIDIQGANHFKKEYDGVSSIFILPPSIDELRKRVIKRDGGAPQDLELRMENASKEIAQAESCDFRIINYDFDRAYGELKKIVAQIIESE